MRNPMETQATTSTQNPAEGVSRRTLLRSTAFVGGSALAGILPGCRASAPSPRIVGEYVLAKPESVIYSTCLQCHVACPIKVKHWGNTLAKISGNPFSPQNYLPHLPMGTPLTQAAKSDGKLCTKGQSAVQTYYDPYRLRKVLKRAGPRGSNRWTTVSFEQFVDDVVGGGTLFAELGDDRHYPGFDEVCVLRDRALAARMAGDAKKVGTGDMDLADFQGTYADALDMLIDPERPDLGPKNNAFVFDAGRIEHGRKELMKWFTHDSFGSINAFEHTTICEQSHHIAYGELTGGATHHLKPDLSNAEFVLFWGTGAFTANFGLTPMTEKVTRGRVERGLKVAVVDPRLSNDAAKADWWLPVKPGADGALAMAMMRWILDEERFDSEYLRHANKASAVAAGEPTWTNASHLVKVENGLGTSLLRASEAGLEGGDRAVVVQGGQLAAVDPRDTSTPAQGDLLVATTLPDGTEVRSAFQLLWDEVHGRSLGEWCDEAGVDFEQVVEVARELTSHGKRAAVELYRGPVQHTDGFYAGAAVIMLNVLIGNADWKGGLAKGGGHWHEYGGKPGNVYDFAKLHPARFKTFGVRMTREKARYEDFSYFREEGYPARRPWYPLTSNVYQEVIPSFAAGYPYQGKILLLHMGTPALASPAGNRVIELLKDPERVPLFIASDIVIGETSMYADYILPDVTYLERWGTPHTTPDVPTTTSKVRQPAAAPLTAEVEVDGERMPLGLEAFLLAVGKRLQLPGFGQDAFGPGRSFDRAEDWYLKLIANIAAGDKVGDTVPAADGEEMRVFRAARSHLPVSVFDEERWRRTIDPEDWPRVVHTLNRGGRFLEFEQAYDGPYMKKRMGKMFHLFMEGVASTRNSMSGEPFRGTPSYRGQLDAKGRPLSRGGRYPFRLITYKEPFGGQSRTISNYWGNIALRPENAVVIARRDAERLGLSRGDRVRLRSASAPDGRLDLHDGRMLDLVAPVEPVEGMRPGVIGVSWHYGHWAYGSNDVVVDGVDIAGDERRAAGICPNPLMAVEPSLGDVCLTDPVGGSASYFDSFVSVEPV
jgi:anaerobic selenocysteine-containing dehydrogenase